MDSKRILFSFLLISLICGTAYSETKDIDIKYELREIKEKMVTKEEFKLFVEMVNKRFEDMQKYMDKRFEDMNRRFEDMNRRFEDLNRHMDRLFMIIGALQGLIIILLTILGWRITRHMKEDVKIFVREALRDLSLRKELIHDIKSEIIEEIKRELKELSASSNK